MCLKWLFQTAACFNILCFCDWQPAGIYSHTMWCLSGRTSCSPFAAVWPKAAVSGWAIGTKSTWLTWTARRLRWTKETQSVWNDCPACLLSHSPPWFPVWPHSKHSQSPNAASSRCVFCAPLEVAFGRPVALTPSSDCLTGLREGRCRKLISVFQSPKR